MQHCGNKTARIGRLGNAELWMSPQGLSKVLAAVNSPTPSKMRLFSLVDNNFNLLFTYTWMGAAKQVYGVNSIAYNRSITENPIETGCQSPLNHNPRSWLQITVYLL